MVSRSSAGRRGCRLLAAALAAVVLAGCTSGTGKSGGFPSPSTLRGDLYTGPVAHAGAELGSALRGEQPRRNLDYLEVTFSLIRDGVVDADQLHFYETWDNVPALLDYLRSGCRPASRSRPGRGVSSGRTVRPTRVPGPPRW